MLNNVFNTRYKKVICGLPVVSVYLFFVKKKKSISSL